MGTWNKLCFKPGKIKRSTWCDFGIGLALGALVFLLIYGPSTLNVTYDSWIFAGYMEEDIIQNYAGWLYYRASGWSWPLTVAENLAVPYGTAIVYTDSLPVLAVFFKLLSPVLPATFQYLGWSNLINLALQGGFACVLLRKFSLSRAYAVPASLLFVLSPVFVERAFRHNSLGCQWIILAALVLYFTASQGVNTFPAVSFFLLCCLSVGVHSYFTPMVFAVLLAALLSYAVRNKQALKPGLCLLLCFAGTFVCAYALGLVTRGGGGGTSGFGEYSMNLNALWNPSSFNWYVGDGQTGGSLAWSRFIPVQPQNYRQYDGFNYMGFGMLLALLVLLVVVACKLAIGLYKKNSFPQRIKALLKKHGWLLAVCAVLTVFAFSNRAVFNTTVLYDLALPEFIMQIGAIFRSSGRLFWPVSYLLVLVVVVALARWLPGKKRYIALCLVLALQLVDFGGVLWQKHQYFNSGAIVVEDALTSEEWVYLMQNHDTVICLENSFDYRLAAGIIRYNSNVQTNFILANRGTFAVIVSEYATNYNYLATGGEIAEGTVYITTSEEMFLNIYANKNDSVAGYVIGSYYILCAADTSGFLLEYSAA